MAPIFLLEIGFGVAKRLAVFYSDHHLILVAIGFLWLAVGAIAVLIVQFRYVLRPRLKDIGFHGSLLTLISFFWLVPAVNTFLLLALIITPGGYVRNGNRA